MIDRRQIHEICLAKKVPQSKSSLCRIKSYASQKDIKLPVWNSPIRNDLSTYRQFCIFLIRVGLYIYLSRTGLDCSIHVWSLSNLSFVTKLEKAHDKAICSMAANHNFLFTGSLNIIKVWQLDADKGESILCVIFIIRFYFGS